MNKHILVTRIKCYVLILSFMFSNDSKVLYEILIFIILSIDTLTSPSIILTPHTFDADKKSVPKNEGYSSF